MLVEPPRTPYDLRFRLLRFPVRVHPLFWLGAALLGANYLDAGPEYLLIWVAVVLVSIVVHELGHAVVLRRFGTESQIVLYIFGGLAVPWAAVSGRGRRILVSLAGPVAGFLLYGLIYASNRAFAWATLPNGLPANGVPLWFLYQMLIFVNLYWGILNLLPVYPLDGGQVSREVCVHVWGTRGRRTSLKLSIAVAGLIAVYSLLCMLEARSGGGFTASLPGWFPRGSLWTAILFALLAFQSYQELQRQSWADTHWDDRVPWER